MNSTITTALVAVFLSTSQVGAVDAVLGRGWVRGAGRLLGLLGLAHGAEPGMARALASAVGDSVHVAIPEAIGRTMMKLTGMQE